MTRSPDPELPDADLQALVVQLGERVKELECLYTVGRVLTATDDWNVALQEVVDAIPPGFQHPDRVAARLRLGDREWNSAGFVSTEWSLASPIRVAGEEIGELEVCFASTPPEEHSEAFIAEERPLLDAIADRIGEAVGKRRVEAKLRRSEEYFQTLAGRLRFQADLLDAVGQAVMATDLEGRILYWNRAAEKLYGWSREEALGRNILDVTPSDRSRAEAETILARLRRGESWTGEFEVRRKDGSTFPVLTTSAPVEDPEGRLTGIIGVSTDLTDRIELEERLRQAERMEAIGRLAGGVAHDFNNILTVIRGHSEIVLRELPDDSPHREDLDAVLDGTRRATDLVSQLLAFGRRQVLDERIVDLGREISEMESILRRLVPERIDLHFDLGEEGRLVEVDRGQLHQVVLNLVMNAADAIEGVGAVTVDLDATTISERDATALASQLEPGEFVRLKVRDDGTGMLPGVAERIFEPFFTTKPDGKGSGLGLATVFGIVKQARGHVAVESEPGEGSVFEVFLPLAEGAASSQVEAEDPVASPSPSGAGTVLVVEDEDSVRELIRRILERAGYEVLVADRGERALEIVERGSPEVQLVVSDVVMPGMGGGELIDRLRALRPDLAIVLISGYSHEEAVAGVHRKASAFLPKPFSPQEIARVVRETLER